MSMNMDDIEAIVFYRKQKSRTTLKEAEDMIDSSHWNLAIQRLYYASFYMASALLLKNKISAQSHNGVVSQLGFHFVTTGKLDKSEGRNRYGKGRRVEVLMSFKVKRNIIYVSLAVVWFGKETVYPIHYSAGFVV